MCTGNWHVARVLIWLVGMLLEINQLFCLFIKFNQLMLEISSGMPISSINFLATCQLLKIFNLNNWNAATTDNKFVDSYHFFFGMFMFFPFLFMFMMFMFIFYIYVHLLHNLLVKKKNSGN
jgi:hypothetical protein